MPKDFEFTKELNLHADWVEAKWFTIAMVGLASLGLTSSVVISRMYPVGDLPNFSVCLTPPGSTSSGLTSSGYVDSLQTDPVSCSDRGQDITLEETPDTLSGLKDFGELAGVFDIGR